MHSIVYVTGFEAIRGVGHGTVSVIASNTVLGSPINVGQDAVGIAYNPHNYDMYVVDDTGGTVSVIDGDRGTVVGSPINVGVGAHAIAYSPDNNDMYVTNEGDGTVSVIDSLHNTVAGSPIKVGYNGNYPIDIAYNPDNHYMYVTMGNNTVIAINPSSNTVVGSPIKVGQLGYPFGIIAIAYDPDNKDMYVSIDDYRAFGNPSGTYDGTVSVIDSFHNTVVGSPINVGQFPVGIAYSPHSKDMYVVRAVIVGGLAMGSAYGCKSLCSKISVLLVNAVLDEFTFLLWSIGCK